MTLHFNMAVMEWLANHRLVWLTPIMQTASFLGDVQGYILVSTLIYVAFDKALAIRLTLLATLAMCLNHVTKILIGNPRPFVGTGDYRLKWAVRPSEAVDLAREYSTPSGHAMAGASFYTYLAGSARKRIVKALAILAIIMIGASRPYLGVHYVEDILLGWAIGFFLGILALRYGDRIGLAWRRMAYVHRILVTVFGSLALWVFTFVVNGGPLDSEPRAFLAYAGTITGIVIARPLELRFIDFDPASGSVFVKGARYVIAVALALMVVNGLGKLFATLIADYSIGGFILQYGRYTALTVFSLLGVPWLFVRSGLATGNRVSRTAVH